MLEYQCANLRREKRRGEKREGRMVRELHALVQRRIPRGCESVTA